MTFTIPDEVRVAVREIQEIRDLLREAGFDVHPVSDHSVPELVRAALANLERLRVLHHSTDAEPMDRASRQAEDARDFERRRAERLEARLKDCKCAPSGECAA